jgi:hypothetical protein
MNELLYYAQKSTSTTTHSHAIHYSWFIFYVRAVNVYFRRLVTNISLYFDVSKDGKAFYLTYQLSEHISEDYHPQIPNNVGCLFLGLPRSLYMI